MNIYHVYRDDEDVDWDEHAGFVIVADSEEEARAIAHEIAQKHASSWQKNQNWMDSNFAHCCLVGQACLVIKRGVILECYNAG